jgi:hypothetical protein
MFVCSLGNPGPIGPVGNTGVSGGTGFTGSSGLPGATGAAGNTGAPGATGKLMGDGPLQTFSARAYTVFVTLSSLLQPSLLTVIFWLVH